MDGSATPTVRIYLQYVPALPTTSGPKRREMLLERFAAAASQAEPLELDVGSLSEAGQMIEADVPSSRLADIEALLEASGDLHVELVRTYTMD